MYKIVLSLIILLFLLINCRRFTHDFSKRTTVVFSFCLAMGFILRIIFSYCFFGHNTDVNDFLVWSDMLYKDGIPAFYASESFTDYPPGYMYVLWIIGFIKNIFGVSGMHRVILVKLPAIIADLALCFLLYKTIEKGENKSLWPLSLMFVFNPATILNSSVWGQVDSVMTLMIVITIILITDGKTNFAYFTFLLSVFIKPQALMYTPILMYGFYENIKPFSAKKIGGNLLCVLLSLAMVFLLALPFGIENVIMQYKDTLSSYPYMSVNAFNVWSALGKNWSEINFTTSVISTLFLAGITIVSLYILFKEKDKSRFFFTGAFICFLTFMLSVKMHERYAYPAMVLMVFAYAKSRDMRHYILYLALTLSQFFNTYYILFIYNENPSVYYNGAPVIIASVINVILLIYLAYSADKMSEPLSLESPKTDEPLEKLSAITKKDVLIMAIIAIVYGVIAFTALGDKNAPETEYVLTRNDAVNIELGEETNISGIKYYLGVTPLSERNNFNITLWDDDGNLVFNTKEENTAVFYWQEIDLENKKGSLLTVTTNDLVRIKELSVYDGDGEQIFIAGEEPWKELFDEQHLVPEKSTYLNSTYFDEIYHARTAYEFIHKLPVYEWTHPPLGKAIIALGINIFGMNPFGWRFMGVVFGILMIFPFFIFLKLLAEKTWIATVGTLLFTFDFMHYVQTRISTIDAYVTFFIILMYLFMYIYIKMSRYESFKKSLVPLALSGISMGLAISCKWNGVYAAGGLAVIFLLDLLNKISCYKNLDDKPGWKKEVLKTLLFCVFFFVILPAVIYMLSYIPYLSATGEGIEGIWKNQRDIFVYHSDTVVESTHPYSSPWYSWPLMLRPIWYYSNSFGNGIKAGISAFGNPLVWWTGLIASLYCIYLAIKNRDKKALFLLIAYAFNFLPWAFVSRTTFIYHYFPSVPFLVLMSGYSIYTLYKKHKWIKRVSVIYAICAIILFFAFLPVLQGMPVSESYVVNCLRWLKGWVLI